MFKAGDMVMMDQSKKYTGYAPDFVQDVVDTGVVGIVFEHGGSIYADEDAIWIRWPITGQWRECNIDTDRLLIASQPCPMEVRRVQ